MMSAPTLSEVVIYPIKGASGIAVPEWRLDSFGLELDRRWMLVDSHGRFISQRTHPRLALIQVEFDADGLSIRAPEMESISLPCKLSSDNAEAIETVEVWESRLTAVSFRGVESEWFETFLGSPVHLVFMPEETVRETDPEVALGHRVSFADAYPLLLLSRESVQDLSDRAGQQIPINRFRPNLIVEGVEPYEEDTWRILRVEEIELQVVKPCDRCSVPQVDQETGLRGVEPARTLAGYRRYAGHVYLGQNVVHSRVGPIRAGAAVEVMEIGPPRPFSEI